MNLKDIKVDSSKSEEGVWIEIDDGAELKIARQQNKNYVREMNKEFAARKIKLKSLGRLDSLVLREITLRIAAKTILLDWKGLFEGDKELKYSPEEAMRLMIDPDYQEFQNLVLELSDDAEHFRKEEIEESAKKSESSLPGSMSGVSTESSS